MTTTLYLILLTYTRPREEIAAALERPYTFTAWHSDAAPILIHRGKTVETHSTHAADPYALMAAAFGRAAVTGAPVPYSLDDTLATAHTLDALAAAARSGERVAVEAARV